MNRRMCKTLIAKYIFQNILKHLGLIISTGLCFYAICVLSANISFIWVALLKCNSQICLMVNKPVLGGFLFTFIQSKVLEESSTWSKSFSLFWAGNLV